jgi:hypothetical protein
MTRLAMDRFVFPFRFFFLLFSSATALVAVWLCWVIFAVLPVRDPSHVRLWALVGSGFFFFSVLSWAYLAVGPRIALLRRSLIVLSLLAIAAGLYGIVDMMKVAISGGDFEGYIVLMGLVLLGHGASALFYTLLTARLVRVHHEA